ncbi:MAG: SprT family zinc-dependent metalloprotease [Longicatena sp.]
MFKEREKIQCASCPVQYVLVFKQVKNINMRINDAGEVVVSANPIVPKKRIDDFVASKYKWIQEHRDIVQKRNEICREDASLFMLFGQELKIKHVTGSVDRVWYDENHLYVQTKKGHNEQKVLDAFVDQQCIYVFADIAHITRRILKAYDLPKATIKIRRMSKRWGSCSPSKQQITLSRRLIHYPIEFIEYVVMHEFVHFIQPNHSKAFYEVIEKYMNDYKQRIKLAA